MLNIQCKSQEQPQPGLEWLVKARNKKKNQVFKTTIQRLASMLISLSRISFEFFYSQGTKEKSKDFEGFH